MAEQDPTYNARRAEAVRRFWSSDSPLTHQRRREASDRAIALLGENKIGPRALFRQMWVDNPFTGKAEFMHSSWETSFLMRCIHEGYPVTKAHAIDYQRDDQGLMGRQQCRPFAVKGHSYGHEDGSRLRSA